jgi:hypothetical protein
VTMKREFERYNCLVGALIRHEHKDGVVELLKYGDAKIIFAHMIVTTSDPAKKADRETPFLDMWLKDGTRRQYDRVDFCPDVAACPANVLNLFKGFHVEKYRPEVPMTDEQIEEAVEPIIKQLNYVSSGYANFLMKWQAHIVQFPGRKTNFALLFRDQGDFLHEGGGIGKNVFFEEFFGYGILGEDYIIVVGDNKELYGNFNSQFEGKLLIIIEEASGKDNHTNSNILKAKISAKKQNVNKKMVQQYSVGDFANYLFTSNCPNPLPIGMGNRRLAAFDGNPVKRGDVDYFNDLVDHLNKPTTRWAYYQYLLKLKTFNSPVEFSNQMPITDAYRNIRQMNAPSYHKWIVDKLRKGTLYDESISVLYEDYKRWMESVEKGVKVSLTEFGTTLNSSEDVNKCSKTESNPAPENLEMTDVERYGTKRKSHGIMKMDWDIEVIVREFKRLFLLEESFVYEPTPKQASLVSVTRANLPHPPL